MCAARRPSVGLDFGTSTTLVASTRAVVPIASEGTYPWMPSLVGFADDGSVVTGERAADLLDGQLVRSIKRAITENRDFVRINLPTGAKDVRTDDLIQELLREAGRRAARRGQNLGGSLVRLGCPAMWDGRQRRRLLAAAQRADLPVLLATMVDEPVAAGIAWLAHQPADADRPLRMVVFDMGGGTLDVAVLDVRGKDVAVLAALGVAEAGDALDAAIAEDLDDELAKLGYDVEALRDPERAREWLADEARRTKILLSADDEHPIVIPTRFFGRSGEVWYSREQLNRAFQPQMERAEEAVELALRVARITEQAGSAHDVARMPMDELVAGIDVVLLSGGMSRVPYVRERLASLFRPSTLIDLAMPAPENAVVAGLAKAGEYGKINIFRPAFDITVEWEQGSEFRTIYEAFTPLVGRSQIAGGGNDLRYVRRGHDLMLPADGKGKLRVVSHSGERLRATLAGRNLDGFPVNLSQDRFEFSIYPDGRIRVVDAAAIHDGRVEDWHRFDADSPVA